MSLESLEYTRSKTSSFESFIVIFLFSCSYKFFRYTEILKGKSGNERVSGFSLRLCQVCLLNAIRMSAELPNHVDFRHEGFAKKNFEFLSATFQGLFSIMQFLSSCFLESFKLKKAQK